MRKAHARERARAAYATVADPEDADGDEQVEDDGEGGRREGERRVEEQHQGVAERGRCGGRGGRETPGLQL